jgi:hypothetical protein
MAPFCCKKILNMAVQIQQERKSIREKGRIKEREDR